MDGMLSQEEINALLNGMGGEDAAQDTAAVSYTHLTLPTIYSV